KRTVNGRARSRPSPSARRARAVFSATGSDTTTSRFPQISHAMPDRAAIVTGASRGIGRALADALGEQGFGSTLNARKPDTLERTAEELRGKGFEVEHVVGNMADEEAIREVVRLHRERFGRLDVLVNNA